MQAVVFADRHGAELAPLCDKQCPALLSLANRPLLEYTLDDLASAGVSEVLLVVSDDAAEVQAAIGDGAMWGLQIRYLLSRGEEQPQGLLARFASLLRPPFLAARGDLLRVGACAEFLRAAQTVDRAVVCAAAAGRPLGLCLVREWPEVLPDLSWPPAVAQSAPAARVQLRQPLFAALDSPADLHRAALTLVQQAQRAGLPGVELAPRLRVDRLGQVDPASRLSGSVAVGAHTWLHRSVRLNGPCAIGADCYIDRDVQISNSVVMPGSYIGEGLQVENAIVAGSSLIRVDLDIRLAIGEAKLLSRSGALIGGTLRCWPERLVAAALLALSLPLWPLALFAALAAAPRAPLQHRAIHGNRGDAAAGGSRQPLVNAWQFATPVPLLRHLPMLWLAVRGDLRLFGARPRPAVAARPATAPQQRHPDPAAGLLGPAQLFLAPDAPEEEIRLWELEFAAYDRLSALLTRLAAATRLLFSGRAWRAAPQRSEAT